jgi:hypothetical protein
LFCRPGRVITIIYLLFVYLLLFIEIPYILLSNLKYVGTKKIKFFHLIFILPPQLFAPSSLVPKVLVKLTPLLTTPMAVNTQKQISSYKYIVCCVITFLTNSYTHYALYPAYSCAIFSLIRDLYGHSVNQTIFCTSLKLRC